MDIGTFDLFICLLNDAAISLFCLSIVSTSIQSCGSSALIEFDDEYRRMQGIKILELTTATPVSEGLKADIKTKFEALPQYKGVKMEIVEKVDESLLGGFLAQVDDQLFDASIRRDLAVIKKQFVENMYIQKIR